MLLVLTMIHDMAYPVKLNIPSQGGSERGSEGYDEEKPPSTLEELYGERHVTLLRDLFEAASRLRDGKVSESEIDIIIDTLLDDYDTPAEYREEVSEALKIKYARHVSNKNGKIPSLLVPMDATYLREIGGFDKIVKGRSAYRGNLSPEDMERAYKLVRAGYADLYNTDFVPGTMPSMSKRKKYSKAETAALQRQCDVDRRRYLDNPNSWSRDPVVISWWKDKAFPERWAWLTAPHVEPLTSEALEWSEKLFDWMDSNEGKAPSRKSKDPEEKSLGSKLSNLRSNKKNNAKGWKTYGTKLMKLAKKRGYPSVFDTTDLTSEALEWTEKLFDWMDSNEGKAPNQKSKDPEEKSLGSKLSTLRQNKKNNSNGWKTYGTKLMKLAKSRDYPAVFDTTDLTSEALEGAEKLFDWMDSHEDKAPSATSKDPEEKTLGIKLSNLRSNKKNNSNGWKTYGTKLMKLSRSRGYPSVFNTRGSK
jgi:hypothetical protein